MYALAVVEAGNVGRDIELGFRMVGIFALPSCLSSASASRACDRARVGGPEQLLCLALMIGLSIVNYGYPIAHLASLKETSVSAVWVGGQSGTSQALPCTSLRYGHNLMAEIRQSHL